ncbi:MAG: DUF3307 domain-containing protein [Deltaproteobacteria bacterium]|nr:DUF3307 domain-containing protein [Deltaproteobacteria bacterium]
MEEISKEILICLSAAHFLGDFVFQSDADASRKRRPLILFKHAFIVSASAYLLCGIWDLWQIPLIIFLTHSLMDTIKVTSKKESTYLFILDQAGHLAVIIAIIILIVSTKILPINKPSTFWVGLLGKGFLEFLILASGLAVCIKAGGILIGLAVKPFWDEFQKAQRGTDEAGLSKGFESGGKIIGYLERSLIFLFILTGQPASIGFLIAAKSILRFGEIKDRQNRLEAEYIIIGTLMSFGYGVFIAYITQFFLGKV